MEKILKALIVAKDVVDKATIVLEHVINMVNSMTGKSVVNQNNPQ